MLGDPEVLPDLPALVHQVCDARGVIAEGTDRPGIIQ
jgi:hypothetical protein